MAKREKEKERMRQSKREGGKERDKEEATLTWPYLESERIEEVFSWVMSPLPTWASCSEISL